MNNYREKRQYNNRREDQEEFRAPKGSYKCNNDLDRIKIYKLLKVKIFHKNKRKER